MSSGIIDNTMAGLNVLMNFRLANQNLISTNVANADTPGYHSKKMEFEDALREMWQVSGHLPLETSSSAHFSKAGPGHLDPEIYDNPNGVVNQDGNTVDRNAEMVSLAENQLHYDAAAEMLRRKIGLLKYSINEGAGGGGR